MVQIYYKVFISLTLILSFTGTSMVKSESIVSGKKSFNVILLFTDQHNHKVTGFNGHPI